MAKNGRPAGKKPGRARGRRRMAGETRHVRLTYELDSINKAVAGAGLVVDALANEQYAEDWQARLAPYAAGAILALVTARLDLLGRVLRGDTAPKTILAPHNEATGEVMDEGSRDVLLPVWEGRE